MSYIKRRTEEEYISECKEIHENKYDYSKTKFTIMSDKITITCPLHGDFQQRADSHLRGTGCSICGKMYFTTSDWIKKAEKTHGKRYDYSKTKYIHSEEYVWITCREHGDFQQLACNHLQGAGCPKCGTISQAEKCRSNSSVFIDKSNKIHNNFYEYPKVNYQTSIIPVIITCPIHGDFEQTPQKHLLGCGCPKCGIYKIIDKKTLSKEEWVSKAEKVHKKFYDYEKSNYTKSEDKITITCPIHGDFVQRASNHLLGQGCPYCNYERTTSKAENEIIEFLESNIINNIERNNRTILNPIYDKSQELDIFIPDKKIAIEYNGLYWHNENQKDKDYHLLKTESCLKKGIRLIHIFEDEWIRKPEIVKSRLLNIFGKSKYRFYARKCEIREVPVDIEKIFLDKNHIQGYTKSIVCYGLYLNNILISIMSFSNKRKSTGYTQIDGDYELLRFCNFKNFSVVGAASKLLKHFIKVYKPNEIISFCDRRWSEGDLYEKLGFTFSHNSIPSYFYIVNGERKHRYGFRKSELIRKYNCPETMSEKEFCFQNKWYRIYDCGTKLYILDCSKLNM